jgi:hypothetical protein
MEQLSLATTIDTGELRYLDTLEFLPCFTDDLNAVSGRINEALKTYQPYDCNARDVSLQRKFSKVEIFAYYPEGDQEVYSRLTRLLDFLNFGYTEQRAPSDIFFGGFKKEFWLEDVVFPKNNEIRSYKIGELDQLLARQAATFLQARNRAYFPLAIAAGISHRSTKLNQEQYIEAKTEFTARDVACQYASYYPNPGAGILYNISQYNQPFSYSLWNFALDLYGKMGGLTWIVPQRLSANDDRIIDLSIGLRFAHSPSVSGQSFYIGYATLIDRFGRWIGVVTSEMFEFESKNDSMVVPEDKMKKVISDAIDLALTNQRIKSNLEQKNEISISIFMLDRFHTPEIAGIKSAAETKFGTRDIKFGLVSVNEKPTLNVVFEKPRRGLAIQINKKAFLVYCSNRRAPGIPLHPNVAKVENLGEADCAFMNLSEAANHILATSTLHWQTMIVGSARYPAPLAFAHDIAALGAIGALPNKGSPLWDTLFFI